ncbi:MarR family winged helix-turn-helix transcriptional regulator [Staphylococcus canis]|uniref:MarR family transcriptional regulator n=1 Tax=Staphylococcus canis TaxID=2724942 RepID=A0ABS0TB09_9STAP|nr:MarR family transcriptional regulator [Staphylococcus canis]MBI5975740.1 MarR family transcriptional regulator [Staphylococcus canis]
MNRTETALKTFIGVKRLNSMLDKLVRNDIKSYGLNVTEFAVLELLYNKGEHTIHDIQERILVASSSTAYVVKNLEQKGFLQRRTCDTDKRVSYASLTDKGQALMQDIFPLHAQTIASAFETLSDDSLEHLQKNLKAIYKVEA